MKTGTVRWKSFGVSMVGPDHVRKGLPNQDFFVEKHSCMLDGIAVSDGLGSCCRSDVGSRLLCRSVFRTVESFFRSGVVFETQLFFRQLKENYLAGLGAFLPQDCAATCLVALRLPSEKIVLAMLGDGLAAVVDKKGQVHILEDDKSHKFSNIVTPMSARTKETDWKVMEFAESECQALLLCTDGVSDDLEKMEEFVAQYVQNVIPLAVSAAVRNTREMLLHWPVPRHSDDKTIACLYRTEVFDE